jgi:hypothetical protein
MNSTGFRSMRKGWTQLHVYCVPETGMKTITLAIDEVVLERARLVAVEQKTTINAMVREFLAGVAGRDERLERGREGLRELMRNSKGRMRPDFKFNREETHER